MVQYRSRPWVGTVTGTRSGLGEDGSRAERTAGRSGKEHGRGLERDARRVSTGPGIGLYGSPVLSSWLGCVMRDAVPKPRLPVTMIRLVP